MNGRGFTLIELLVTLAILGILLSMALPVIPIQTIRYDQCAEGFYHKMVELRELTYRTDCRYEIRFGPVIEVAVEDSNTSYSGFSRVTIYKQDDGDPYPKMEAVDKITFPEGLYLRYNLYDASHKSIRFDPNLTLGSAGTFTFFDKDGDYKRKLTVDVWTNRIYLYKKEG